MLTLRLIQHLENQPNYYRVEVALEDKGSRQIAVSYFEFKVKQRDYKNIRWYLEDFPDYLQAPEPEIAKNIEQHIKEIGVEIFKKVFYANEDTHKIWQDVCNHIDDTRVEIVTSVREAATIPWELICDPQSKIPLILRFRAFVRTNVQAIHPPQFHQTFDDKIRILLVICRPGGGKDPVSFRSVATKLINQIMQLNKNKLTFYRVGLQAMSEIKKVY